MDGIAGRQDYDFYKNLLDNLNDPVYFVDKHFCITYWNKAAERMTGYTADEVVGLQCRDSILRHTDVKGNELCDQMCLTKASLKDGRNRIMETRISHKDGRSIPVLSRIAPIYDNNGRINGAVIIFSDNSQSLKAKEKIEELRRVSLLDPLTKLVNRGYIEMQIRTRLSELKRFGTTFGMLIADIDNLSWLNEAYGHETGDEILKIVSRSILFNSRPYDVIGRLSEEEFAIILANIDLERLNMISNRFLDIVKKTRLNVHNDTLRISVSIGATLARTTDTVESVIKRAQKLMDHSKKTGKNQVTVTI